MMTKIALFLLMASATAAAAPPEHSRWEPAFGDGFKGPQLDQKEWESGAQAYPHIGSSRRPEELAVGGRVPSLVSMNFQDRDGAPVGETAADVLRKYRLAWSDDFQGDSLDTTKWRYRTGPRHWSMNLPENVSVANGKLRIALKKERSGDKQYTSGGVISKQAFRYGYYEARFRVPAGRGWHTSFWLMNYDLPSGGSEPKQEIDICEQDSINPHRYSVNVHKWQGNHQHYGHKQISTPDLSVGYHTWGAEFTPERVKFFFDGRLVATTDISSFAHGDNHIWLTSIASHLGNTGTVDDSKLPAYAEYDWVRFYERKPGSTLSP